MTSSSLDYDAVQDALAAVGAPIDAAEAHGLLCGMLSAAGEADAAQWMAQVLDGTEPRGDAARQVLEQLASIYEETRRGLDDSNLSFHLLLPAETLPIAQRARCLGAWCNGFLFGLGSGAAPSERLSGGEVAEALTSLADIARVDSEAAASDDEGAYTELVEFVRVAALLIREQLQPRRRAEPVNVPAGSGKQRLH